MILEKTNLKDFSVKLYCILISKIISKKTLSFTLTGFIYKELSYIGKMQPLL